MILPDENTKWLLGLLSECNISVAEFEYRKKTLEEAQKMQGSEISAFSDRYYNIAHEIKSFCFLRQFGNVIISEDYRHESGCDCKLNNYYQIECVCSSVGENTDGIDLIGKKDGNAKFYVGNYNESFLFCRLTSSIRKKLNFYNDHIKNGTIAIESPYIIFLGLGALANEIFPGDNGISFTGMLFGKGFPILSIDKDTGSLTSNGYSNNRVLFNHNRAEINCNIFSTAEYQCVAGIIISAAKLNEEYTANNTWFFINPYSYIKADSNDFRGLVYWDLYSESEYGPYKDGAKISYIQQKE